MVPSYSPTVTFVGGVDPDTANKRLARLGKSSWPTLTLCKTHKLGTNGPKLQLKVDFANYVDPDQQLAIAFAF